MTNYNDLCNVLETRNTPKIIFHSEIIFKCSSCGKHIIVLKTEYLKLYMHNIISHILYTIETAQMNDEMKFIIQTKFVSSIIHHFDRRRIIDRLKLYSQNTLSV
jgi:hypothetical protein